MNRREVISRLSIFGSGILLASTGLIEACNLIKNKRTKLTENDLPLLNEIGETIIPATATSGGAKALCAVHVHREHVNLKNKKNAMNVMNTVNKMNQLIVYII